ncbi:hypothetical protein D1631_06035 [Chryseobacterium nematophagum]|uniref:Uncharacterized protein n=2 Tax=Chryseobacterium nematophagum TaxID=2305228 RepID=A0A3M7TH21_9FLAO|nr:hypothetical protein D1631_06035 [Chryseobacterium nematophagum]
MKNDIQNMKLILIFLLLNGSMIYAQNRVGKEETSQQNPEDCPSPNPSQFLGVCNAIWNTSYATTAGFGYTYQEKIWEIACAKPSVDSFEIAKAKIQKMWLKNRENFLCFNFPNSIATDKNITKFSLESGVPGFILEAIKRYNLDMNFKDPADNKTIMDYIKDRQEIMLKQPPIDQAKIDEYEKIYNILKNKGAKHAKDL